ncbi:ankyrin repeat-containing domain protein [Mycena filopes]|nr:ankyrin repeat-containing domain protein [Mycena filopes]
MTPPAKPAKSKINQLQDAAAFGLEILDLFADLTKDVPYLGVVSRCVEKVLHIGKEMKDNKQRADELLDKILDVSRMLAEGFKEVDVVKRSAAEEKLQEDLKRYVIVLSDTADALTEWMEKGFLRRVTSDFPGIATNVERKIQTFRELFNASRLIGLSKGQDLLNTHMQHLVDDATRTRLNNWLHPPQISVSQRNTLNQRHPAGTGSWLLSLPTFKEWIYTPGSFLWLHGISGCGKTILSSIIIDDLRRRAEQCTYFYFDTNNPDQNTVTHLLSSLVTQLSVQALLPDEKLKALWKSYNNGQQLPTNAVLTSDALLPLLAQCKNPVYIVLDALDECSEHVKLLKLITKIVNQKLDNVHLLVTSCPETAQGTELCWRAMEVSLDGCVDKDIELHLDEWLSEQGGWIHSNRYFVKSKVLERSSGMFRLLTLHLDEITACTGRANKIQETLAKMPKSLHDKYTQIMGSFEPEMVANISRAMNWLIYAQRLLAPAELVDALAMDFEKEPLRFDRNNRFDLPEAFLGLCAGLIVSSKESLVWGHRTIVKIAHASVKEYFLSTASLHIPQQAANHLIARTCIGYLLSLDGPLKDEEKPYEDRLENSDEDPMGLINSILEFLCPNTPAYHTLCCVDIDQLTRKLRWSRPLIYKVQFVPPLYIAPLYIAAAFGIGQVVWNLLDRGANPNTTDPGHTGPLCPLDVASREGYIEIVQLLLKSGAELNATALCAALMDNKIEVVRLLLEHGADVNAWGAQYGTPLQAASPSSDIEVVRLLLDHGADVNFTPPRDQYHSCTALQAASIWNTIEVVHLLLEHGADVNTPPGDHWGTALQAASHIREHNLIEVVHLVLEHGADVNAPPGEQYGNVNTQPGERYGTALQAASFRGDIEFVRLLLEHGADVNTPPGEQCDTALQTASFHGYIEVTRLLLDHGADVDARPGGEQYDTALQSASRYGHIEVARLLLDHGADVNAQGDTYGTALQAALSRSKILLLDHGADVDTRGEKHHTALQAASSRGNIPVIRLLLDHGADVNTPLGEQFSTALQSASRYGYIEVVRLLLDHSADVNTQGEQYGTALQATSRRNHIEVARLLLDHSADVNAGGGPFGTALEAARHTRMRYFLSEMGAIGEVGADSDSDTSADSSEDELD